MNIKKFRKAIGFAEQCLQDTKKIPATTRAAQLVEKRTRSAVLSAPGPVRCLSGGGGGGTDDTLARVLKYRQKESLDA